MEKPTACVICDADLEQPLTGRPRVYCSQLCRRVAEYELRRLQALLLAAEKSEQRVRARQVTDYMPDAAKKELRHWSREILRLRTRLHLLLSGERDEECGP